MGLPFGLKPAAVLKFSVAMTSGYGIMGLAAPALFYKVFFKGGVLPGSGEVADNPKEGDKVHKMMARWFGFALLANNVLTMRMTARLTTNLKPALEATALTWIGAAAVHTAPLVNKSQPKELTYQQLIAMPLTAALCLKAAQEA